MTTLPKVLCVDDEPNVLHGLRRSLRGTFEVYTASGGEEALKMLVGGVDVAVVCSDMRMPGMDGATFLERARDVVPDATRVLLSGQADVGSLVRVINGGGIFRFLVKPCERADLVAALFEAAEHHRLKRAEAELLDGTLVGSVRVLSEALSLASPEAFGRSERLRQLVVDMAKVEGVTVDWEIRTTASLACLGLMSVPPEILRAVELGETVNLAERAMVDAVPRVSADLIAHIPRLQGVSEHLRAVAAPHPREAWVVGAVRAAMLFLSALRKNPDEVMAMSSLRKRLDSRASATLWSIVSGDRHPVVEIHPRELDVGMELVEPLTTTTGLLLMPAGLTVTESSLERLRNFALRYGFQSPLRVRIHADLEALAS